MHCGFDLHFPDDSDIECLFPSLLALYLSSSDLPIFLNCILLLLLFIFKIN